MTLAQLRYLMAVVDANLNITTAAIQVNATQPGISKQLKLLEEELGFQIFARKGRSLVRITPGGAQVIERARGILTEASNIRAMAANHRHEAEGELRILTSHTQARFFLPSSLKALQKQYPSVSVHLSFFADEQQLRSPDHDNIDLAVVSAAEGHDAGEIAIPIYRWNRMALAPADHPLAKLRRPVQLGDLAQHPLIGYESLIRADSSVSQAFAAAGLAPRFAYTAQDAEVIKSYVRSGMGIGLLAEMALTAEDAPDLVALDISQLFPVCTAWAVLPSNRVVRQYTLDLLAALAPHVEARDIERLLKSGVKLASLASPQWRDLSGAAVAEPVAAIAAKEDVSSNVTPFPVPPRKVGSLSFAGCG